jgi:acid phosphatase class B
MVFKDARAKVEQGWTTTKKLLAMMSVWGLFFSLITIGHLAVAFDYDDTLVDSSKSFEKASAASTPAQREGPGYWAALNNAYDLEAVKYVPFGIACVLRGLGFRIVIMAERQGTDGDALKKEWRKLAPRSFIFTPDPTAKHLHMQEGHFVAFFGDSDQDMLEAKKVNVLALRVRRGKRAQHVGQYSPGKMGETVIPLSQF